MYVIDTTASSADAAIEAKRIGGQPAAATEHMSDGGGMNGIKRAVGFVMNNVLASVPSLVNWNKPLLHTTETAANIVDVADDNNHHMEEEKSLARSLFVVDEEPMFVPNNCVGEYFVVL